MRRPVGRIWQWIDTSSACWMWTGALQNVDSGYGVVRFNDKKHYAHRLIWSLFNGPVPDGAFICHHCDEPRCVRPSHLYAGTQKENVADMFRRGRARPARGEAIGCSKLTEADVLEMRRLYSEGGISQRAAGRIFGASKSMAQAIIRRKYWRHI